jgi:hypothetical protein
MVSAPLWLCAERDGKEIPIVYCHTPLSCHRYNTVRDVAHLHNQTLLGVAAMSYVMSVEAKNQLEVLIEKPCFKVS